MNDPGVDEYIDEAARDLEHDPYEREEKREEAEEEDFLDPRHVWRPKNDRPLLQLTSTPADGGSRQQHARSLQAPLGLWLVLSPSVR